MCATRYLRNLKTKERNDQLGIIIRYDRERNNYVLSLYPKLEEWILSAIKEAGLSPRTLGIIDDQNWLHDFLSACPEKIKIIVKRIFNKSRRLQALKQYLCQLINLVSQK